VNENQIETALIKLFGSTSRARILLFLFQNPQQSYYQREIMFEAGLSLQAAQRELKNLCVLGIIQKQETKSRVYYHINQTSPYYEPLKQISQVVEMDHDSGK